VGCDHHCPDDDFGRSAERVRAGTLQHRTQQCGQSCLRRSGDKRRRSSFEKESSKATAFLSYGIIRFSRMIPAWLIWEIDV